MDCIVRGITKSHPPVTHPSLSQESSPGPYITVQLPRTVWATTTQGTAPLGLEVAQTSVASEQRRLSHDWHLNRPSWSLMVTSPPQPTAQHSDT